MTADLWTGEETVVPAALRGYRSWNLQDARLCSTAARHEWASPQVTARCLSGDVVGGLDGQDCPCDLCARGRHAAPVRDCTCGIYGWYSPEDTRLVRGHVFGVVEASGRVVLASHGFRAQSARIVALAIEPVRGRAGSFTLSFGPEPPSTDELHGLARWAKEQGIPVFATRAELLAEYPPEDVSALVQHECDETCQAHAGHGHLTSAFTTSFSLGSATGTYAYTPTVTLERTRPSRRDLGFRLLAYIAALFGVAWNLVDFSVAGLAVNGGLAAYWTHDLWPYRPDLLRRSSDQTEDDE